ncbi:MAG TPA: sigma-70 family RNA polymerase sigma factor [candidate division Zixibacteria bacterium]|nr:sigma-70 family RNA polymerase sigma factor [candidate division Zixibacteria bacterium]
MAKSDSEIWKEVLSNKSGAWGELVVRYQALVYAVATRAGLHSGDVEDCFQQVWYLLYKNRKKITDPSRLSAWLVTTAKRESIRLSRRASSTDSDAETFKVADTGPLQDEKLETLELQSQLEIGLNDLENRCRELLYAMFFAPENKSYEEIAKEIGIAPNSIGPIRRRCLERLKKILEDYGYLDVRAKKK